MRDEFGISFLSRMYKPNVWYGDPNSCCDIKRQLLKFHTTTAGQQQMEPSVKLQQKATSYYYTDHDTPYIGDIVNRVLELIGPDGGDFDPSIHTWFSQYRDMSAQFPNERADWMYEWASETMPDFDSDLFLQWLDQAQSAEDLLRPPVCNEEPTIPDVKDDVVVDDVVVRSKSPPPAKPDKPAKKCPPKQGNVNKKHVNKKKTGPKQSGPTGRSKAWGKKKQDSK